MVEGLFVPLIPRARPPESSSSCRAPVAIRWKKEDQIECDSSRCPQQKNRKRSTRSHTSTGRAGITKADFDRPNIWGLDATKFIKFRLSQSHLSREGGASDQVYGLLLCADFSTQIKSTQMASSNSLWLRFSFRLDLHSHFHHRHEKGEREKWEMLKIPVIGYEQVLTTFAFNFLVSEVTEKKIRVWNFR